MNWHTPGYGGPRRDPEQVKRDGWQERGVLVIAEDDQPWRLPFGGGNCSNE
jgi:hypothetical protein